MSELDYTTSENCVLSLSLHVSMLQCGVSREEDGAVSAVVVVQHHPVIQRRGDKVDTAAVTPKVDIR